MKIIYAFIMCEYQYSIVICVEPLIAIKSWIWEFLKKIEKYIK